LVLKRKNKLLGVISVFYVLGIAVSCALVNRLPSWIFLAVSTVYRLIELTIYYLYLLFAQQFIGVIFGLAPYAKKKQNTITAVN